MVPAEVIRLHIGVNVLQDSAADTVMQMLTNAYRVRVCTECVKKALVVTNVIVYQDTEATIVNLNTMSVTPARASTGELAKI